MFCVAELITIQFKEMKQLLTRIFLVALIASSLPSRAQVLLNEIYAEPNSNTSEFFEFYNINAGSTPISMDGYTLMSYFEEGGKKGFYVLDMPNLFIPSKGYFVGASSIPFNYQGTIGSTAANFSWNDPTLPLNYGYIKKWVATGNSAADGNKNYDEYVLPVNFNDFFSRKSGNGATYNTLIFKNGQLVNNFFGGTGGNTGFPSYITSMPNFKLESVTATNTRTYTVSFNSYKNKGTEYVTQDIGTDNGFIRAKDGYCGTWEKSSSTAFHTPGARNMGGTTNVTGSLTIDAHLYPGAKQGDSPFIVYNITSGPTTSFPVELQVYLDNGTVPGQLDASDTYVTSNTEITVNGGPFTTNVPAAVDVLIIAQTDAGCIDQIVFVPNSIEAIVLPIQLKKLQGSIVNDQNMLQWTVLENENGTYFEIQKSNDGKNFTTAGVVSNSKKEGEDSYQFSDPLQPNVFYYRIKAINKDQSISYSKIIVLKPDFTGTKTLSLMQNPVQNNLSFSLHTQSAGSSTINIYNLSGLRVYAETIHTQKGKNTFSIQLHNNLPSGTYLLKLSNSNDNSAVKFLKQ